MKSISEPHPGLETWNDYHAGALPEAERDRLQRHLTACRRCVDLLLDFDAFAEPTPEKASGVSDFEKAAVWRSLDTERGRNLDARAKSSPWRAALRVTSVTSGPLESARKTLRWPAIAAVAASLLFATAGFAWWNEQRRTIQGLEARIAELSRPQVNAVLVDLRPGSRQRSARGADARTDLEAEGPITLGLHLEEPAGFPDYQLAIVGADGTATWNLRGLEPGEHGSFLVTLPSGALPVGEYDLRLHGLDDGQKTLLEIYPVRFR